MQTSVTIEFADGEYDFALPLERINELQTKCGIGIGGLFARVRQGATIIGGDVGFDLGGAAFYALDVIEPIRQGLIGGGKGMVDGAEVKVTPAIAQRLLTNYVTCRPLVEAWALTLTILGATLKGYDPPGGDEPGKSPATPSETTTAP